MHYVFNRIYGLHISLITIQLLVLIFLSHYTQTRNSSDLFQLCHKITASTAMPKVVYSQQYRAAWEKDNDLKDWIVRVNNDPTQTYCKYCKCNIASRLADLKRHATCEKHKAAAKPFSSARQKKIDFVPINKSQTNIAEAKLAMYCAVHTSILAVDHLSEACNAIFADATATPLKLHRTKCTAIINNVLGPHFKKQLMEDIADGPFSLIIDESTDLSIFKMLGVVIKDHSKRLQRFVTTYLGLVQIENGTADSIVAALVTLMDDYKLKLNNLSGLGTDNASVMVGVNNGVYQKLKTTYNLRHLILVRCVCHSLQLALSTAAELTIPRNIDFLIKETYNWFQHSTSRQLAYTNIYKLINDEKNPLKILQLAKTRWISIEPALRRILDQWLELKTHFEITRLSESCYTSELLYSMYKDPVNKVYLEFIYPIIQEVQKVNKNFEAKAADPVRLHQDLINLTKSIASRVINPNILQRIDILTIENFDTYLEPDPYMGYAFEQACSASNISTDEKTNLKTRCRAFLTKLLYQLKLRLPTHLNVIGKITVFAPNECLRPRKMSITDIALQYYSDSNTITKIEAQWSNLNNIDWHCTDNTENFWIEVSSYVDASGKNPFEELSRLAIYILRLPHSNADVERLFSQMNLIKNKIRNSISTNTVDNILLVRYGLKRNQVCCQAYEISQDVISKIGTMETYVNKRGDNLNIFIPDPDLV